MLYFPWNKTPCLISGLFLLQPAQLIVFWGPSNRSIKTSLCTSAYIISEFRSQMIQILFVFDNVWLGSKLLSMACMISSSFYCVSRS